MGNKINLIGTIFSEYNNVVLSETEKREGGSIIYKCKCSHCGNEEWELSARRIKHNSPISCGCRDNKSLATVEHGFTKTKFHRHWCKMRSRCNRNNKEYKSYIEKNINVDKRWLDFVKFKDDMYDSYIKHVEEFGERNTTLDRLDNNKDYSKDNCRWASYEIQLFNRDFSKRTVNNPILATRVSDGYNIITYNARMFSLRFFNTHKSHIIGICKGDKGRNVEKGWTFKYISKEEWDNLYGSGMDYIITLEDFKLSIPYYNVIVDNIQF